MGHNHIKVPHDGVSNIVRAAQLVLFEKHIYILISQFTHTRNTVNAILVLVNFTNLVTVRFQIPWPQISSAGDEWSFIL